MSTLITIVCPRGANSLVPTAAAYALTAYVATDNSGAEFTGSLNGTETPPWTAKIIGTVGTKEASVTFTDEDTNGNPMGPSVTYTETGTGGQVQPPPAGFPAFFPLASNGTGVITVTGS